MSRFYAPSPTVVGKILGGHGEWGGIVTRVGVRSAGSVDTNGTRSRNRIITYSGRGTLTALDNKVHRGYHSGH